MDAGGFARTQVVWCEFIDCGQPNGDSCINADHPGVIEEVIYRAQEDRKLRDGNNRTHEGLKESLSKMAASPLLDANESEQARPRHGLLISC